MNKRIWQGKRNGEWNQLMLCYSGMRKKLSVEFWNPVLFFLIQFTANWSCRQIVLRARNEEYGLVLQVSQNEKMLNLGTSTRDNIN